MRMKFAYALHAAVICVTSAALDDTYKPASDFTKQSIADSVVNLDFSDFTVFENVDRGFVVAPESLKVVDENGSVASNPDPFLAMVSNDKPCPESVNPSTWQQAQMMSRVGVYKVMDKVYQVRGFDLAVMTIVEAPLGLIVFDPLGTKATSRAAFDYYLNEVGPNTGANLTLAAVVYTHSHMDHFGGVLGLVDDEIWAQGNIQIVAPLNFAEEALSENYMVIGNMGRRAWWQFGNLLPANENASIHAGLAFTQANSVFTFAADTLEIKEDIETHTIAGVTFEFMLTLSAEAPAEMHSWVEDWGLLNTGENAVMSTHNFLTLRGAKARDTMKWSTAIQETLQRYGDRVQVLIGQHHWPKFGNGAVVEHLTMTRDYIKFTHDQSVRLLNLGFGMEEISETIQMPKSLDSYFNTRGHYGHLKHNSKEVYQFYVGWWDGNPAALQRLPPVERAQQFVADMGGIEAVMKRGQWHYDNGNYRWCAESMNQAVFSDPSNMDAKYLQADCMEQIGYAEESGIRRNFMLTGVQELRHGKSAYPEPALDASFLLQMPLWMMLQSLEIIIDPIKAEKSNGLSLNLEVKDTNEKFNLIISHAVLVSIAVDELPTTARVTLTADSKLAMILALTNGDTSGVSVAGDLTAFTELMGCLSTVSDGTWNIIEPREFYEPKAQNTYPQSEDLASSEEQTSSSSSDDDGLSTGAWVGICIACVVVSGAVGAFAMRKMSKSRESNSITESTTDL
ncbi:hypothetical protein SARC_06911 [Sphaeroforma arctica JP610]|uniref:Metallo-beta-lactamase domain-containing protein n=1 Tax=Sphaeroforma arctica JP610 TaxID=667725 RepID=A0A0L0FW04_9EUKA|nr:hypothetical protein SARC_06911 [Sphaeroforma arctica JP610]KNC80741.1 hypothetical protein SARC_06911 [Sphaeroforma arctica JP610]|eukprot:XP_014154643.1 hypothetical protein SARC_06911 [Sphaeroforma arctica JP610]